MSTLVKKAEKPRLSFKIQTISTLCAIAGAVIVPQIFHVLGSITGLGTALGETFLPMHLPIIIVGLLAGPYAGAMSGLLGPLVSFAFSGMPSAAMLPFMMIELCAYGFAAGVLRNVKLPNTAKVLIVQIFGRLVRAAAIIIAAYGFGYTAVKVSVILTSVKVGLFGICLQLILIPLIIYRIENGSKNES